MLFKESPRPAGNSLGTPSVLSLIECEHTSTTPLSNSLDLGRASAFNRNTLKEPWLYQRVGTTGHHRGIMGRRSSAVDNAGRLKVRKNRRVTMHYRVRLSSGVEFDASDPSSPLEIVCGRGETIQGLEKRILGMCPGEHKEFVIPPEEAFGAHDKALLQKVDLDEIPANTDKNIGGRLSLRTKGTQLMGRIVKLNKQHVVADFNHPLAGESLHYEIHILNVAEATPELLPV